MEHFSFLCHVFGELFFSITFWRHFPWCQLLLLWLINKNECHMTTTIIIYWKEFKWVRVWKIKIGGVHVSHLKYGNVLLFHSVKILDTKSWGFRSTHNNKIYTAVVNEIVNCRSIQAFYNICFTNYHFELQFIYLFIVLICSLSYILSPLKILSLRSDRYSTKQIGIQFQLIYDSWRILPQSNFVVDVAFTLKK